MSAKNDITGDAIASKANSKFYRDNYENIFAKKATEKKVELDGGICNSKSNDGCRESQLREYAEGAGVQGQADQEQAVAWLITHHENQPVLTFNKSDWASERFIKTPLYANPPKRKPLIECQARLPNGELTSNVYDAFEKGYAQAKIDLADQETVAWIYEQLLADGFSERTLSFGFDRDFDGVITPLYAQPLKRQPLSDDDIAKLWGEKFSGESEMLRNFARAIEKAHGIGE